ncbi:MAG TPA: ABC transporter permease [Candidatus Hydrogenedentes bacterium]|nr:ABC transporter permease [Candidatus Hydrogenedentota bacterium]
MHEKAEFTQQAFRRAFAPQRLWRAVKLGMRSLWLHRLRSLLTLLGIVFGVCSVISMLAVGEGVSHEAQEQIRKLGSSNIILRSRKPDEEKRPSTERSYVLEYGLTYRDLKTIKESLPGVTLVVPARIIRNYVFNATRRIDAEIFGTVPWYPEMRHVRLLDGRYFSEDDMEEGRNVCVLSSTAAESLFPIDSPLGRNVRVGSDYYKVIGVMEPESSRVGVSENADQPSASTLMRIYIPLIAAKERFGEVLMKRRSGSFEAERVELHEATVQVGNQRHVEETSLIIRSILKQNHKKTDYEIIVPLELLRAAERTKQMFNLVLGAIAAISLIVGGIGIMNIMLASVTERTREIGIRRALGAKRRDIIIQFLIETVILSGAGGIIGVAIGILIPFFITLFAEVMTIVTVWAPLVAFSISALVGVVFGIYPAMRAADMDPVEALRHE